MSIRRYLLVSLSLTVLGVMAIATVAGYLGARHEADELFDAQLAQYARSVIALLQEHDSDGTPLIARESNVTAHHARNQPGHAYEAKVAFEVWDRDGRRIAYSESFPNMHLPKMTAGYHDVWWQDQLWRLFMLHDETNGRWIISGERGDIRGELAEEIAWQSILPVLIAAPLAALLIWLIIGAGLKPLRWLAAQFALREASDLAPIPLEHLPSELEQLTISANDLLRRLAGSFERERRFASDAAHELRTPLAALLVHLENAIEEATPASRDSLQATRANAKRLQHMVEQLLALARSTPDQYLAQFERVDLAVMAREVMAELKPLVTAKDHRVDLDVRGNCNIEGDPDWLAMLLRNLLINAINYTPSGGAIHVRVRRADNAVTGQKIELSVCDNGPGIPEAQRVRVFDRFYRVGGDRHHSKVAGSGLGLAIVRHIVELHRADIELSDPPQGSGLCAVVSFPPAEG